MQDQVIQLNENAITLQTLAVAAVEVAEPSPAELLLWNSMQQQVTN